MATARAEEAVKVLVENILRSCGRSIQEKAGHAIIKCAPVIYCRIQAIGKNIIGGTLSAADAGVLGGAAGGAVTGAVSAGARTGAATVGVAGSFAGGVAGLTTAAVTETVAGPVTSAVAGAVAGAFAGALVGVPLHMLYNHSDQAKAIIRRVMVEAFCSSVERINDRHLGNFEDGSLVVPVYCYSPESFLNFLDEFDSGIFKKNLIEQFSKVQVQLENLAIRIENLDDIEEHKIYLRTHVLNDMKIPENIMVRDLGGKTRMTICQKLDVERIFGDDCRALAGKVGMSKAEVDLLWKGQGESENRNPTENVLKWWETRNDATVRRLVQFLQKIGRLDVVDVIVRDKNLKSPLPEKRNTDCTRFERQTSLEDALSKLSIRRGISETDESMKDISGPIPLCIPNNYKWDASKHEVLLLENVRRTGLTPCAQGLQFLRSITGPICVVCVAGPARTGKSYLLSQLQESSFRLGHTMKAETIGIWIGDKAVEYDTPTGEKITVVFLDSEGIGSMDNKDSTDATDYQIFTLIVLLSSLLIYNSKNVPTNNDLETLHFVSKLSDCIRVRSHAENTREDVAKLKESCPELFWLIRDVSLEITDINDQPVDIKTYLEQKILKTETGLSKRVQRRNEIREDIKSFFKSVDAFTLPIPSDNASVLRKMGNLSNNKFLNREFLEKLDILKTIISEKYHSKKGMNDSLLTGSQLADMIESYTDILNTKECVPNLRSVWELTAEKAYQRAGEKSFDVYKTLMSPLSSTFPCEEANIMAKHENCMKEAIEVFRQGTLMYHDHEENLKELKLKCVAYDENGRCNGGLLYSYLTKNKELSEEFCRDRFEELVKKDLKPILKNIGHQSSYESISSVINRIEESYWEYARGPSAHDVYQKFHSNLEERKKEIKKTIIQLAYYNNEQEKERSENIRMEMICKESEREIKRLQKQIEEQKKQHLHEIQAIIEAIESKFQELNAERIRAMNEQNMIFKDLNGKGVSNLRREQKKIVDERNQKIQKYQQMQGSLYERIEAAHQEIQVLQNRPPTVVHQREGCSVM